MTKHERIFSDMSAIIKTTNVQNVSFRGHVAIDQETTFPSAYLVPGADTLQKAKLAPKIDGYDNTVFVRCIVNESLADYELQWAVTRDAIIQAVLKDAPLWSYIIDRDVESVVYDDFNNYPRISFEIIFSFLIREDVV